MKLALLFLALTVLPTIGMQRACPTPSGFTRNYMRFNVVNPELIKSLAARKLQITHHSNNSINNTSCFVVTRKAGRAYPSNLTSYYFSSEFREKIKRLHAPECNPCGPDSILDDREYVELRPCYHADEAKKWQDYC